MTNLVVEVFSTDDRTASTGTEFLRQRFRQVGIKYTDISDEDRQDLGTSIAVILGSAALVELAKGIADLIRRDRNSSVKVTHDGKSIEVNGISEDKVESVVGRLSDLISKS